jgi:hypothetical protein
MYPRVKRVRRGDRVYEYVQLVEGRRVGGKVRQRVVATLGRLDEMKASGELDRLAGSFARLDPPPVGTRREVGPLLVVREYVDETTGTMRVEARGEGQFTDVTLRPRVTVDAGPQATEDAVAELHRRAHALCFIARSVNFAVLVEPAPVRLAAAAS